MSTTVVATDTEEAGHDKCMANVALVEAALQAIFKAFPNARGMELTRLPERQEDLYAFGTADGMQTFVARKIGDAFVGGVACLSISPRIWSSLRNGVCPGERHYVFWAHLAQQFMPDGDAVEYKCGILYARQKPIESVDTDPYEVERVVLTRPSSGAKVAVLFADNVPVSIS